jgi:hypothetical protein
MNQYRLRCGTRAARPTAFRFTEPFEIGEARILTPIGRTPDSATDDTNSTRMRIFPAKIEDNIFIKILYTHFCTI